jgi:N-acylneuraminate cytidylyltransferase
MSTDFDVINHFFENIDVDSLVYLRPTSPLREPHIIDAGIDFFLNNNIECSGMRSMHKNGHPPYKVFRINEEGYCAGFFSDFKGIKDYTNLPRQTFPESYLPNGYVDICIKSTLEEYGTAFGTKILPFVTEDIGDVDTEDDFKFVGHQINSMEHILKKLLEKN